MHLAEFLGGYGVDRGQKIQIAGQNVEGNDVRIGGNHIRHLIDVARVFDLDADHGGDAAFDLALIYHRGILQNHVLVFQTANPLRNGRNGEPDFLRDGGCGNARVFFQHGYNFQIGTVHNYRFPFV